MSLSAGVAGRPARRTLPIILALALACVAAVLWPAPALAHAPLVRADPPPGAQLRQAPSALHLWFAEPIDHGLSHAMILGPAGPAAASTAFPPSDPREITLTPAHLPPGSYDVVWQTTSLIDGHTRSGSYRFTVLNPDGSLPAAAAPAPRVAMPQPFPRGLDAAGRWIEFLTIAFLIGGLAFRAIAGLPAATIGQAPTAAAFCLFLAGAAEQALSSASASRSIGAAGTILLETRFGRWTLVELVGAAVLALILSRRTGRPGTVAGWAAAGLVVAGFAVTSHEAAGTGSFWGGLFLFVHVAAACLWLGTLAHLGWWLVRRRVSGSSGGMETGPVLRRFSALAAVSVIGVAAFGVLNALAEVPAWAALADTGYGRTLLVKLSLVGLLLLPAGANAFFLRPVVERRPSDGAGALRRTIAAELVLGAAVFAASVVLAQMTPARAALQADALKHALAANGNPASAISSTSTIDGTAVTLTVTPGAAGLNRVEVEVPLSAGSAVPRTVRLIDPAGQIEAETRLEPEPAEQPEPGEAPHGAYAGFARLSAHPGNWTAVVQFGVGGQEIPVRFVLPFHPAPVPPALTGGAFASPTPQVSARVPIAIVLAAFGLVLLVPAARRPAVRRLSPLGAAAVESAPFVAAAVLLATGLVAAGRTPATAGGRWGIVRPASVDRAGGVVEYVVPTPNSGLMMPAIGPDGRVWVTEMDTNKVAVLDPHTATFQELTLPPPERGLMGAVVDPDLGRVWFTEEDTNQIEVLDPQTGDLRKFTLPTPGGAPVGIALDAGGHVWVTEQTAGKIAEFDPATAAFHEYPIPTANAIPYWLAVAPDGRIWFAELEGRAIGVLDPATGAIHEYRATATEGRPAGVAVDRAGIVWFATLSGVLGRLDPSTGAITAIPLPGGGAAYGVAAGPAGTIWVGRANAPPVQYDPAAGRAQTIDLPTKAAGAWWPAVESAGNAWFVEGAASANRLAHVTP